MNIKLLKKISCIAEEVKQLFIFIQMQGVAHLKYTLREKVTSVSISTNKTHTQSALKKRLAIFATI